MESCWDIQIVMVQSPLLHNGEEVGKMMNLEIDELDRKILDVLRRDARTPFKHLGLEIGVPDTTIHFRVRKMIERGVIKGFTVVLDDGVEFRLNPEIYEGLRRDIEHCNDLINDKIEDVWAGVKALARRIERLEQKAGVYNVLEEANPRVFDRKTNKHGKATIWM